MRRDRVFAMVVILACSAFLDVKLASAQCPAVPNTLTNGQTADAAQVMANFNALLNCLNTGEFVEAPSPMR